MKKFIALTLISFFTSIAFTQSFPKWKDTLDVSKPYPRDSFTIAKPIFLGDDKYYMFDSLEVDKIYKVFVERDTLISRNKKCVAMFNDSQFVNQNQYDKIQNLNIKVKKNKRNAYILSTVSAVLLGVLIETR